jgi:uncharacterized membrane protein
MAKKGTDGKTIAIISYITWVGLIIAFILNSEKKDDFAKFHIRQALLLMLASLLAWIPFIGWMWGVLLLVLWIMALISAVNGEKKPMPVLGSLAQSWFKGL